jgi:hypothetical protein
MPVQPAMMFLMRQFMVPATFALGGVLATPALAGRHCEDQPPTVASIRQGMALAQRTSEALDAEHARTGARVVLLARAGQDLSKYRLRYSHAGWAYKTQEGPWRVLHKLNQCGTAGSALYRQGLGEFFLDTPWRYEASWVTPAPALQQPLYAALTDPQAQRAMFVPAYSMVSYAWGQRYQQSNQWAVEWMAAALERGVQTREQAQAWMRFKGYEPTPLKLGALTRLGGRMTRANIAFDDHPNDKRFQDRIETVTVDSLWQWLPRAGLASEPRTLQGGA